MGHGKMVKQHSTTSQKSSSSTSSVHSAPPTTGSKTTAGTTPRWPSIDRILKSRSSTARGDEEGGKGGERRGRGGNEDREPLIEGCISSFFSGASSIKSTKSIGQISHGMQSLYNIKNSESKCSINSASAYRDTLIEDIANSTDSSSLDGELKKRRRRLRFPFGKKSSSKNKLT